MRARIGCSVRSRLHLLRRGCPANERNDYTVALARGRSGRGDPRRARIMRREGVAAVGGGPSCLGRMEMRRILSLGAAIAAVAALAGCGGGSSPSAPTNVAVAPHDGSAIVTWEGDTNVEWWVWIAPGTTLTLDSCATLLACQVHRGVTSPYLATGLVNGTTYTLIVNGRSDGSPVGENSPPISFVPRLAGTIWSAGTPLASTLRGVGYTGASAIAGSAFVASGAGGSLYSSADAVHWTSLTSNVATDLNAAMYGDGKFVVAGDAGVILTSTDAVTWTKATSGTTSDLRAFALSGTLIIAVGTDGTILTSGDGLSWTARTSGTTSDLYGVAVGTSHFVAVGAGGTLLTSTDAVTWQSGPLTTTLDLKSIAYGAGRFVAVGANGAVVTSTDGVTWTTGTPIAANSLSAVVYGTRFVAVGSGGAIFTSADGITWAPADSGTTNDLNALAFSTGVQASLVEIGYVAVGAAGVNLTAF
jgi:hypothetical protein